MAWSNEVTFKFIDLYQSEPAIWNPRNRHHKDKTKISDAWDRISEEMDIPVEVLKKKKETLMAAFRLNHKKKLASLKSGTPEEIFNPIWIFYEPLATFLSDVYDCRSGTSNSEDGASSSFTTFQEKWNPVVEIGVEELSNGEHSEETRRPTLKKRRLNETSPESNETPHLCDRFVTHAMSTLASVITNFNRNASETDEDECDIYGRLLAKKLKKLPDVDKLELMYEIDSLFIQKRIKIESLDHMNSDANSDI